ncbi:hypothetical protein QL285_019184 [Trifolium repens]|nr:hypothetical protein QL285_019184 [Trifolium repens]
MFASKDKAIVPVSNSSSPSKRVHLKLSWKLCVGWLSDKLCKKKVYGMTLMTMAKFWNFGRLYFVIIKCQLHSRPGLIAVHLMRLIELVQLFHRKTAFGGYLLDSLTCWFSS